MPCTQIGNAIVCSSPAYRWEGYYFEWHYYCGPIELTKSGDPKQKSSDTFYRAMNRFGQLSDAEKKKFRSA